MEETTQQPFGNRFAPALEAEPGAPAERRWAPAWVTVSIQAAASPLLVPSEAMASHGRGLRLHTDRALACPPCELPSSSGCGKRPSDSQEVPSCMRGPQPPTSSWHRDEPAGLVIINIFCLRMRIARLASHAATHTHGISIQGCQSLQLGDTFWALMSHFIFFLSHGGRRPPKMC